MDEPVQTDTQQVEQPENDQSQETTSQAPKGEKGKLDSGYYYWIDREKKYFEGIEPPNTKPQKVESDTSNSSPSKSNGTGASAWNTIGTWEEKHFDKNDLKEHLQNQDLKGGDLPVKDLDFTSGTVSLVTVRGKRKIGYNLSVEFKLSKADDTEYEVKCSEFTEYGDEEVDLY